MRIKLGRWQRIGIALSVLAFVGLGVYAWIFEARHRDQVYHLQLSTCDATLRFAKDQLQSLGNDDDGEMRETAIQKDYETCKTEAVEKLQTAFDHSLRRLPIFLATVLVLIILAWLIEWFLIEMARRARRGMQRGRRRT
jgi:hypothetical protein